MRMLAPGGIQSRRSKLSVSLVCFGGSTRLQIRRYRPAVSGARNRPSHIRFAVGGPRCARQLDGDPLRRRRSNEKHEARRQTTEKAPHSMSPVTVRRAIRDGFLHRLVHFFRRQQRCCRRADEAAGVYRHRNRRGGYVVRRVNDDERIGVAEREIEGLDFAACTRQSSARLLFGDQCRPPSSHLSDPQACIWLGSEISPYGTSLSLKNTRHFVDTLRLACHRARMAARSTSIPRR